MKVINNILKKLPKSPLLLFSVLVTLLLLISVFQLYRQFIQAKNQADYSQFVMTGMQDQIKIMRLENEQLIHPTPAPYSTNEKFEKSDPLDQKNSYLLECFDESKIQTAESKYSWLNQINKDKKQYKVKYFCYNKDKNEAISISNYQAYPGGQGSPGLTYSEIAFFDPANSTKKPIMTLSGNYLSGLCQEIVSWSKNENIYLECRSGDGASGNTKMVKLEKISGTKTIVQYCVTRGNTESCIKGCDASSDCTGSQFCNLENHQCTQKCDAQSECAIGACLPAGPIMGCRID